MHMTHQNYENENTPTKNRSYDWLINYITKLAKSTVDGMKEKILKRLLSLFKTYITKSYSKPTRAKSVYGGQRKPRKTKIKKQSEDKTIKTIEGRISRDIKNLLEQEKEAYYKPVGVANFYSNTYIEYVSNGYKNKALSITEYLDEIKPYLKDIINNLKKSDTWKIQLTIAINIVSPQDTDEEREMHSKSDNKEMIIYSY